MILEYTVSMFSGYMGPRASKNAFTAYTLLSQGGGGNVHFGPIWDFVWGFWIILHVLVLTVSFYLILLIMLIQ